MKPVEPNLHHPNAAENHEMSAVMEIPVRCVARFGLIDRRIRKVTSPLDSLLYACYIRLVNGHLSSFLTVSAKARACDGWRVPFFQTRWMVTRQSSPLRERS
jgi:hypothetical protein